MLGPSPTPPDPNKQTNPENILNQEKVNICGPPIPIPPNRHPPMHIPNRTIPIPNLNLRWFKYWFLVSLDDEIPIKCIASHTQKISDQSNILARIQSTRLVAAHQQLPAPNKKNEIDQRVQIH